MEYSSRSTMTFQSLFDNVSSPDVSLYIPLVKPTQVAIRASTPILLFSSTESISSTRGLSVAAWEAFRNTVLPLIEWVTSESTSLAVILGLTLISLFTFIYTSIHFHRVRASPASGKIAPTVPYWFPLLFSVFSLAGSPPAFVEYLRVKYGYIGPYVVKAAFLRFCVVTRAEDIDTIYKASKNLNSHPGTLFALRWLLATPKKVLPLYASDDSGLATKPKKGSTVKQEDRINYWQASLAQKVLTGQSLLTLSERYLATLLRILESTNIRDEWVELPDLYGFLQQHVTHTAIETLMGTEILERYPSLITDFWQFDQDTRLFLRCLPRWMIPKAYRNRDRMLAAMKDWQAFAHKNFDASRTNPEDPDWDPFFGSKLMRGREEAYCKMDRMTAEARASEGLGFLFALNANAVPAVFWMLFEALKDRRLGNHMDAEVQECRKVDNALDIRRLTAQPLLQSAFAETLRLRVAITSLREHGTESMVLKDYHVPPRTPMVLFSRVAALNRDGWSCRPRTLARPLEDFWAERFLETSSPAEQDLTQAESPRKPVFSMAGLSGCWIPFGGGNHMCPGRHFAKSEMIGTFAALTSAYDLELVDQQDAAKVEPDFRWSLMGTLPPQRRVRFRIRRRAPGPH